MSWKTVLRDYLHFTRKDRIGILVILFLLVLLFLLPKFIPKISRSSSVPPDTAWIASMKRLEQTSPPTSEYDEGDHSYQYDRPVSTFRRQEAELFYFDPNILSEAGWKKLGIREKTIGTIMNYLSKGGRFKIPEDLQRVYGLQQREYDRLAPFVRISNELKKQNQIRETYEKISAETREQKYSRTQTPIDINTADTSAFIALPGIGSKLAARIISFREKLGGFYSVDQVGETFGLPDSTFQKIKQFMKLENVSLRTININTATLEELKTHPYIRYNIAQPVIAYRNAHGPFQEKADLKKVMVVTEELYQKIAPYLTD